MRRLLLVLVACLAVLLYYRADLRPRVAEPGSIVAEPDPDDPTPAAGDLDGRDRLELVFPPISVRRIRLRILDEQPDARGAFHSASVLEIEAYRR